MLRWSRYTALLAFLGWLGGTPSSAESPDVTLRKPGVGQKPQVVIVAGRASHGYGEHEFNAGGALLARALDDPASPVRARLVPNGWPSDPALLRGADALVLYMDGGEQHPLLDHLAELDDALRRGVGLVALHYALEVPKGPGAERFLAQLGGFYESGFSTNPVWTARVSVEETHPIGRGVRPFTVTDEWYFNIRFAGEAAGLRPIASAIPDDEARRNPTWPPFAADHITAGSGRRETLLWVREDPGGGRGVGFTGGHFHWNWGNDDLRRLVLNAIVWAAGAPVPFAGMPSPTPSLEDLEENQDEGPPWFFHDREELAVRFQLERRPGPGQRQPSPGGAPVRGGGEEALPTARPAAGD